jgi:beta-lactamase superfamily II metal-dependent hydrolase
VVYRTDQDGLITIRSDGHRLHVETAISPAAEFSNSPAARTNRP